MGKFIISGVTALGKQIELARKKLNEANAELEKIGEINLEIEAVIDPKDIVETEPKEIKHA